MLAITAACSQQPPDTSVDEAALRAADATLSRAVQAKDLDLIMSFYADDASILPAASPMVIGKEAIRTEWAEMLAIPGFDNRSELVTARVSASGDWGYTQGVYVASLEGVDGVPVTERGKWVSVWRREADGSWRCVVEIYNTDAPPPDHKSPLE